MEKVIIVFTINNKFVAPTYISIKSLFDHAEPKTEYECLILSGNLTNNNKKILSKLSEGTRHKIKCIFVDEKKIEGSKVTYSWPKIVYYRLFLCDILKEYKKVIFSDVDVLFKGDLAEVYNENIDDVEIAMIPAEKNNEKALMHQYYNENKHKYIYWSGFMLMNLEMMRKNDWSGRCRKNIEKYDKKLKMCDLKIINLTADEIKELPLRYCMLESLWECDYIEDSEDFCYLKSVYEKEKIEEEKAYTQIIHYAGKRDKPWIRRKTPDYYLVYMKQLPFFLKMENMKQTLLFRVRIMGRMILRK